MDVQCILKNRNFEYSLFSYSSSNNFKYYLPHIIYTNKVCTEELQLYHFNKK